MIRAKAVYLFRNEDKILLTKGYDPAKDAHYLIPVGGGIEFGETSEQAMIREVREEIAQQIHSPKLLGVLENLFSFDGMQGHEIVFVYQAEFSDITAYDNSLHGFEPNHVPLIAEWFSLEQVRHNQYPIYPNGIKQWL